MIVQSAGPAVIRFSVQDGATDATRVLSSFNERRKVVADEHFYRCQHCEQLSLREDWLENEQVCPKCGGRYDWLAAQDDEE